MASYKLQRMTEDLKRELAGVIRELKDSRISTMLSVIKVDLSGDMSYAKVYVSDLNGKEATQNAVKGLESAKGYIKREISNRLRLRKAPELKFIIDDSLEYSANINRILEDIHRG
jgi:ribosome-binding factor A